MESCPKLRETSSTDGLIEIDIKDLKILWYDDWWDGPLSGILNYQGKKCRFQLIKEHDESDTEKYYRRFLVIELTPEQIDEEEYWQNLFVEKVGSHWTIGEDGKPDPSPGQPSELHHEFYDPYQARQPVDLSESHVLGFYQI